ncbi:PREDICTED: uncharacterized protein LOC108968376 [Bactrocera latifrons]|uniref:uncharacterized protein LOC108968376 n=1 Tax=Bactrocera latifrons TaxID=174628 RepID=UPI0008DE5B21|nr:PREDICTED: uncharacterized protein LOC108968376 [Bactrocera latifrons]
MLHLSDSDNEDENCIQIRRERRNLRNNSKDILEMDDYNFFKNFRINKGSFIYILEEYENVCGNDKRQGSLSPKIKLSDVTPLHLKPKLLKLEYHMAVFWA